tara:strand:- start:952 stop:1269 length:318 start_codon:yes stop_codon:yes gene_type:complete
MRQGLLVVSMLMCLSFTVLAHRFLIVGKPTKLLAHNGYFTFPADYVQQREDYHLISIANTVRICYRHKVSSLSGLPVLYVIIQENDYQIRWVCYRYDPKFFEVDY